MAYVALADRDHEQHLHDPQTFVTKYVWSQDHKVIAVQYSLTAIFVGVIALILSGMMRLQLAFPDSFSFIAPQRLLPVRHHARHDHGDLSAHRLVPGWLRQLPDPVDVRQPGHGFPLFEYAQLLGVFAFGSDILCQFLCARRADRRGLDLVPTASPSLQGRPVRPGGYC